MPLAPAQDVVRLARLIPGRRRRSLPRRPRAPHLAPGLRRYHFHFAGLIYVFVTIFLALGAINSQNNLLFAALGLAIGGLLVSGLLSGGALLGIRLERMLPQHVPLGEPLTVRYRVRNANRLLPAMGLHLVELSAERELGSAAGWASFVAQPESYIVRVRGRTVETVESILRPCRRGRLTLGPVRIWTTFPFGLVKKSITFSRPQSALVHPPLLPLRAGLVSRLLARSPYGQGSERSPGTGEEFFGLREYAPGDSPRRIAWKRSARTGELIVRQNAMPAPVRAWIVLRLAPHSRGAQPLNERAIALVASILRALSNGGVAVGLAIPSAGAIAPPRLGRVHVERLLDELAVLEPGEPGPGSGFPDAAARGGACLVIHAGEADRAFAPRHAVHFEAAHAERYLQPGDRTRGLLALLDSPPPAAPAGRLERLMARLRAAIGGRR